MPRNTKKAGCAIKMLRKVRLIPREKVIACLDIYMGRDGVVVGRAPRGLVCSCGIAGVMLGEFNTSVFTVIDAAVAFKSIPASASEEFNTAYREYTNKERENSELRTMLQLMHKFPKQAADAVEYLP